MTDPAALLAAAVWFGHDHLRSFAMVHRPARPTGEGVVICNTLGFDGLLAQRPFRHLAEVLAGLGFTVARIDYEGTGDAPGDHEDPDQVAAYLASIDDAVDLLRTKEACTRISLISVRVATCLATRYALDHPGVDRLVLWAPCPTGRQYVRELRAMSRLSAASRPGAPAGRRGRPAGADGPGSVEAVGFEFTAATLDDLARLDLGTTITHPPAERVLVLDRDDIPPNDAVVEALAAVGTAVDHQRGSGWARYAVADETESVMPTGSLAAIAGWMSESRPGTRTARTEPTAAPPRDLVVSSEIEGSHREHAVWIDDRLFAVVSEPLLPERSRRSAIVLSNTGSVSHTGPGRLHVQLARRWADLGFTVIRVDLGGTGNSPAPPGQPENRPYDDVRIDELMRTVEWVWSETDVDDVTLFGICSGAFASFHAALRGADVQRIVLVNPLIFHLDEDSSTDRSAGRAFRAANTLRRPQAIRDHLGAALAHPGELAPFALRALRGLWHLLTAGLHRVLGNVGIRIERRTELAGDLQRLAADGIDTMAVFAAGEAGSAYLRAFGGTTLDRLLVQGSMTLVEVDGGDHVFAPPAARTELVQRVTEFLDRARPAAPAPEPSRSEV
ncbi:alpha/beta fold hydrolase [Aquihabitans sp. McL0605]|uniref:alpha/beta fold hydrolase n=1 Tax=Aquihabitans sp. McL0605 TaxID=3415671 RepID=UPI003CEAE245